MFNLSINKFSLTKLRVALRLARDSEGIEQEREKKTMSGSIGGGRSTKSDRRTVLKGSAATLGLAAAGSVAPAVFVRGAETTLNWLTWAGHSDPYIIEPFEKATGIKIKAKEYATGDIGIVEMTQNPGLYDLITTSMEFLPQFVAADTLEEMDPEEYSGWKEYLPEFRQDIGYNVGGKFHSIVYEFGFNALGYLTDRLSAEDVSTYEIIRDPRVKGKVATQDWWGNAMGCLSAMAGFGPNNGRNPYVITNEEFEHLRQTMFEVRPQFGGFFEYAGLFSGFANGSIWLQPGGGDWAAQLLADQGVPAGASIPKEGGYLWGEAISIVNGTTRREAAKKFVDYCLSAEAQARFATKASYTAIVPNGKAWEIVRKDMPDWAKRLQFESFDDPNAITPWRDGRIAIRVLPEDQTVEEWADLWQEFKNL